LDAVMLRVPGNQGNWWHFLAGAPFFLAFPMIWLRLRALFSDRLLTRMERRLVWSVAGLSLAGTLAVQTPFLLHLAGTSNWQSFSILSLGFGIVVASAVILVCLIVYSDATGTLGSRSGWLVSLAIVWPILFELIWFFIQSFLRPAQPIKLDAV
jgi:hypothetical protein